MPRRRGLPLPAGQGAPAGVRLPADPHRSLTGQAAVDLALFYDRNNILLSPSEGYLPCSVFATIVRNPDQVTAAGNDP